MRWLFGLAGVTGLLFAVPLSMDGGDALDVGELIARVVMSGFFLLMAVDGD